HPMWQREVWSYAAQSGGSETGCYGSLVAEQFLREAANAADMRHVIFDVASLSYRRPTLTVTDRKASRSVRPWCLRYAWEQRPFCGIGLGPAPPDRSGVRASG